LENTVTWIPNDAEKFHALALSSIDILLLNHQINRLLFIEIKAKWPLICITDHNTMFKN